ncbi:MAG: tRNA pseudouridine(13) synthase TruD [Candidatus Woesearchaeota archaeon]
MADYFLKQVPEDFIVDEIFTIPFLDKGDYAVFKLVKRNRNTEDVVQEISKRLGIPRKNIGYAGVKDKHAVTTQLISIFRASKERVSNLKIENSSLEFRGFLGEPISLGSHDANRFKITVRNVCPELAPRPVFFLPNYFDEQRFSSRNVDIGKAILKKDFKSAALFISESNSHLKQKIQDYLEKNPNSYVGVLRLLPKKTAVLHIHSFQSLVFNRVLAEYILQKGIPCSTVKYIHGEFLFPKEDFFEDKKGLLPGFGSDFDNADEDLKRITQKVLNDEEVSLREFIIRELPEFSQDGGLRDLFFKVGDLKISKYDDELNRGKKKFVLEFVLSKSSYATIVVKALFS